MINDYHRALSSRAVTKVTDSAGQFTETTSDSTIYGYIAELSGGEVLKAKQLHPDATAELYTAEASLNLKDRIVDGTIEYEIVYAFTNFHYRYLLRRWK